MKVQEIISLMKAVSDYGMTELKLDDGTMKLSLRKEAVIQEAVEKQPVIWQRLWEMRKQCRGQKFRFPLTRWWPLLWLELFTVLLPLMQMIL